MRRWSYLEDVMKKIAMAGLTALALISTVPVFAQQTGEPQGAQAHERYHPSAADIKAFTDARVAGLKAGLQLTPDQEKNWAPVEQAIREMAQARQARMEQWRTQGRSQDTIAKMRSRADALVERASGLKKLADASEPLYRSLTDEQKHRLRFLIEAALKGHGHRHGWGHRG
jgi:zinc resistance-associated protein